MMMKKKQSIVSKWDRDEMGVAEILIQLTELIPVYDYSSFGWGAKRRRSRPKSLHPPAVTKSANVGGAAGTSPATPLMFSPSESDDKPNTNTPSPVSLSHPKIKLQNKEELMQSLTELTHQKESLVKEMEATRRHLYTLRTSNLELKHRKQVIIYGSSPAEPTQQTHHQYQQLHYPFLQQQHTALLQWSTPALPPADNKIASVGLPDLNLTLDEFSEAAAGHVGGYDANANANGVMVLDANANANANGVMVLDYNANSNNSRALASAQARKRRMQIFKEKNQSLRQR